MNLSRITIDSGILFKVIKIEDLICEVWVDHDIYIEIDVTEYLIVEGRRRVNIAIVAPQFSCGLTKTKNVVPLIEPVIFSTDCTD